MDKKKVLVVDDEWSVRSAIKRCLNYLGHHINVAPDGETALSMLETEPVDLLILDVMLPDIDGFEVLRRIKAKPELQNIKVLLISGLGDADMISMAEEEGAVGFLSKPFTFDELKEQIQMVLMQTDMYQEVPQSLDDLFAEPTLDYETSSEGEFSVKVDGPLTASISKEFCKWIEPRLKDSEKTHLILDLTNCDYVDSTIMGKIIRVSGELQQKNKKLLVKCSDNIRETLSTCGLDKILNII